MCDNRDLAAIVSVRKIVCANVGNNIYGATFKYTGSLFPKHPSTPLRRLSHSLTERFASFVIGVDFQKGNSIQLWNTPCFGQKPPAGWLLRSTPSWSFSEWSETSNLFLQRKCEKQNSVLLACMRLANTKVLGNAVLSSFERAKPHSF